MPYIAKLNPEDFDPVGFRILILNRVQCANIASNEEVFIWTAETADGFGLIGRGITNGAMAQNTDTIVTFSNLMLLSTPLYAKEHLRPFRDIRNNSLLSFLAERLYFYSLNRVVEIRGQHVDVLRRQFFDRFLLN